MLNIQVTNLEFNASIAQKLHSNVKKLEIRKCNKKEKKRKEEKKRPNYMVNLRGANWVGFSEPAWHPVRNGHRLDQPGLFEPDPIKKIFFGVLRESKSQPLAPKVKIILLD